MNRNQFALFFVFMILFYLFMFLQILHELYILYTCMNGTCQFPNQNKLN